ncbi:hypothetical protein [Halapricum sp. CBA1109]|nr:hypothetical protein [Halapricum sp. CBA1109]
METDTHLEEWASLVGGEVPENVDAIAREESVWRADGTDDPRLF